MGQVDPLVTQLKNYKVKLQVATMPNKVIHLFVQNLLDIVKIKEKPTNDL